MTEAHLSTTIIENPEMLKYQQRRQQVDQKNEALGDTADSTTAAPKVASMVNGETLEDIRKVETSGWQFHIRYLQSLGISSQYIRTEFYIPCWA